MPNPEKLELANGTIRELSGICASQANRITALEAALRWVPEVQPRDSKGRAQLFIAWSEWEALKAILTPSAAKAKAGEG